MSNCLVKKLSEAIDNNNMPYLNYVKVHFNTIESASDKSNGLRFMTSMGVDGKIKVIGDNIYFADSSLVSTGNNEIAVGPQGNSLYVTNSDGILLISDATEKLLAIAGASSVNKGYYINTKDFRLCSSFTEIAIQKAVNSVGDIKYLAANIGLTALNLSYATGITGNMRDFVISQIDDYGRTSGTISFLLHQTGATINGSAVQTSLTNCVANIISTTNFTLTFESTVYTYTKTGGVWSESISIS